MKNNKLDLIKVKIICFLKAIVMSIKGQATDQKQYLQNLYLSDKEFVFRIYKEFLQINNMNKNNSIKNRQKF